jgi:hypothetical protein
MVYFPKESTHCYTMDHAKKHVYHHIKTLKHHAKDILVIEGNHQTLPFELVLITTSNAGDPKISRLLARWRKRSLQFLPSTKPITVMGTRAWLVNQVINQKDRVLFLIRVKDGKNNAIEIDNVIRGVPLYPGIMASAIQILIQWAKQTLEIKNFSVQTSDNNIKAIALYQRIGFIEYSRIPLIRVKTEYGSEFQNAPKNYTGPIKRYRVLFSLQ